MPIYDFKCQDCGEQFEALVLKGSTPACPACQSARLEQLISMFSVDSASIRQANIGLALIAIGVPVYFAWQRFVSPVKDEAR